MKKDWTKEETRELLDALFIKKDAHAIKNHALKYDRTENSVRVKLSRMKNHYEIARYLDEIIDNAINDAFDMEEEKKITLLQKFKCWYQGVIKTLRNIF